MCCVWYFLVGMPEFSLTYVHRLGRAFASQVAALRVLAGLLEASAEGMDAFRVRDGFNVLYHALAQENNALQQVKTAKRVEHATAMLRAHLLLWMRFDRCGKGLHLCAMHPVSHGCACMELVNPVTTS